MSEPRRRPIVIEGELAERLLTGMEAVSRQAGTLQDLQRDMREVLDTLRGTREYDGLVARLRDAERKLETAASELKAHIGRCEKKGELRVVGVREWRIACWTAGLALLGDIMLILANLSQHGGRGH